jgi:hypothetical protein
LKRRHDFLGQQLQFAHDVLMRHVGEEEPANQMRHAEGLDKASGLREALLRTTDAVALPRIAPTLLQRDAVGRELVGFIRDGEDMGIVKSPALGI